MKSNIVILEMKNISKSFPGVKALENVSFNLHKGEVFAIVGENGAGKSTLIKILAGSFSKDSGSVIIDNKEVNINNPHNALEMGISTIYQATSLVPEITVTENIFLGRQIINKAGVVNWRKMHFRSKEILSDLSINLNTNEIVSRLSSAQQQLVEIAKAFSHYAKIIIMDEPTSAISEEDAQNLFKIIRRIKKSGISVIYISHRLKEIFEIADRTMVLRDGKRIKILKTKETNEDELANYMVGRNIENLFGTKSYEPKKRILMEVRNLSLRGNFEDVSFKLKEGEILGFSGLVGAGRSEIVRSIYGLEKIDNGEVILNNKKLRIRNPNDAIKQGIALVSEDRRIESVFQEFSVKINLTILLLKKLANRFALIKNKKEEELARTGIKRFNIKTPSTEQIVMNLSGGNQQKVALAKCLLTKPKVLILDEPTKGIDVGAKEEIHILIKELANRGVSIILVSSELPEIIGMSHRVVVIKEGRIVKIFNKKEINEEKLIKAAVGII